MENAYLIIKALHIFFVVSWFAGLFYLPRLFVNLAMLTPEEGAVRERLLLMARKLARFMLPLSIGTWVFGVWLWLGFGVSGGWLHVKLTLVVLLTGYAHYCNRLLRNFEQGRNTRDHVWYRVFNEVPALVLLMVVALVVLKPF